MAVWVGFPQAEVRYERTARAAGRTKYRLRSMISLGLDAIVSFSRVPLRIAAWLGAAMVPLSLALLVVGIVRAASGGSDRWLIPVALLALLDGVVLLLLGVLGAYVARVGDEARARPLYVVREETGRIPLRKRRGASGGSARSARRT